MKNKPHIIFIGAGNLATNLALALYQHDFSIKQVYSRTLDSAEMLAKKVNSTYTNQLEELILGSYLYIVSLRDDALLKLLPNIMKGKKNALVIHTAGSIPMDVLSDYGTRYGVLYPMQTFSKSRIVSFETIPFFIEANNEFDKQLLISIASELSSKVFEADSSQRKKLHLAAVFASNFTNHMYTLSAQILDKYGLPFESMHSLIEETTQKIYNVAPIDAQTGPAIRNDQDVMTEHLKMLSDFPDLQEIYRVLSNSILKHKIDKK